MPGCPCCPVAREKPVSSVPASPCAREPVRCPRCARGVPVCVGREVDDRLEVERERLLYYYVTIRVYYYVIIFL